MTSPIMPPARDERYPVWTWIDAGIFFGLGLPCLLFASLAVGLIGKALHVPSNDPVEAIIGQAIGYALLFSLLAAILRMQYEAPFWSTLGWIDPGISVTTCIAIGVLLAFTLELSARVLHLPEVKSTMTDMLHSPRAAVVLAVFGVFVAPVAEELAFRGLLQPLLVRSIGVAGGIIATAIPFGLLHLAQNSWSWPHAAVIAAAGAAFGVLRHLTGSTRASIVAHAAYNATLFAAIFSLGRNSGI